MDSLDFDDDELQEIFSHLRMLVIRSGYADWDKSTIDWLSERVFQEEIEETEIRGRAILKEIIDYSKYFSEYLRVRSTSSVDANKIMLRALLRTNDGERSVDSALLITNEGQEHSLLQPDVDVDKMLTVLENFIALLEGQPIKFFSTEDPGESLDHEP